jgi:hypothetical protein
MRKKRARGLCLSALRHSKVEWNMREKRGSGVAGAAVPSPGMEEGAERQRPKKGD